MTKYWLVALLAATASPVAAATSFSAFATFTTQPGGGFYWQNNVAVAGPGTGGALFTTLAGPPAPAIIPILFSFFGAGIVNQNAMLIFRGIDLATPAIVSGTNLIQPNVDAGSFSITAGGIVELSGTYSGATIYATVGGTSAVMIGSSVTGTLAYGGAFPGAIPPGPYTFSLNKTGIPLPGVTALPGLALNDFDPQVTGQFGTGTVPEPGTWAMLIAGFAGVGLRLRRAAAASGV